RCFHATLALARFVLLRREAALPISCRAPAHSASTLPRARAPRATCRCTATRCPQREAMRGAQREERDSVKSYSWLRRLLVTIVLAVTTAGLQLLGFLWLLPWAEACLPRSSPALVAQATSPLSGNLASRRPPAPSAPSLRPAPWREIQVREVQK